MSECSTSKRGAELLRSARASGVTIPGRCPGPSSSSPFRPGPSIVQFDLTIPRSLVRVPATSVAALGSTSRVFWSAERSSPQGCSLNAWSAGERTWSSRLRGTVPNGSQLRPSTQSDLRMFLFAQVRPLIGPISHRRGHWFDPSIAHRVGSARRREPRLVVEIDTTSLCRLVPPVHRRSARNPAGRCSPPPRGQTPPAPPVPAEDPRPVNASTADPTSCSS
jgi:hypothetical protein